MRESAAPSTDKRGPTVCEGADDGMFSQTVEYALRAMVCLAGRNGEAQTSESLAAVTRVPHAYLSKVMKGLVAADLVRSQRGVKGGFVLARRPEEISILAVVNAIDPIERIATCPLKLSAHGKTLCPLHRRMDDALAQVESAFSQSTLADVMREPTSSIPLCDGPPSDAGASPAP